MNFKVYNVTTKENRLSMHCNHGAIYYPFEDELGHMSVSLSFNADPNYVAADYYRPSMDQ